MGAFFYVPREQTILILLLSGGKDLDIFLLADDPTW